MPRALQTFKRLARRPALRPIAGRFASTIFALGILGTGLLAVAVLAGSAAYAISEAGKWPTGLARQPLEAKAFFATLAIAKLTGVGLNFTSFNPDPGALLVRGHQWCRGRTRDGSNDES
jgi:Mn2+/Fe2+ NRAMP family transporter